MQCQSSVLLAPLIVVSCLTVPTAPHDAHTGGGKDLMELSGKPRSYMILRSVADMPARPPWPVLLSTTAATDDLVRAD